MHFIINNSDKQLNIFKYLISISYTLLPIFVQTTKQCNKKSNIKNRCKTVGYYIPNFKTLFEVFDSNVTRVHCLWFCDERCVLNDGIKEAGSSRI